MLPHLSGIYFGNDYGATENDYNYSIALSTLDNCFDIVTGEVILQANNTYLFLDIYASEPAEQYNVEFTIPEGKYKIDNTNSYKAGTISNEYSYLYVTGDNSGKEFHFVSGSVVVTASRIEAHLFGTNGKEYKLYTPTSTIDNSQNFVSAGMNGEFSTLDGDINIEYDEESLVTENYGDYYVIGRELWSLCLENYDTGELVVFELLAPYGTELTEGEYEISSDLNIENTALPGYVMTNGSTSWSWYYKYDDNNEVISNAPLKSGKLIITRNNDEKLVVDFEAMDDKGNKICGKPAR